MMLILLFLLPGILLVILRGIQMMGASEMLAYMIGASLSFFVVFSWITIIPHVSLLGFSYSIFALSIITLIANHRSLHFRIEKIDKHELCILGAMSIVIMLRLAPYFFQIVPAGVDMSREVYYASSIYKNDCLQWIYPSGFASLCAIASLLGNLPAYRAGLLLSCLSYALLTLGYYVLFLNKTNKYSALFFSIAATFLAWSPQYLIGSGKNLSVLSAFFLALFLSLTFKNNFKVKNGIFMLSLLFLLASILTDPIFFQPLRFMFLLIPLSFFALPSANMAFRMNKAVITVLIIAGSLMFLPTYLHSSVSMCPVGRSDLEAFKWIDLTMGKNAVFMNNPGDGGIWIPAVTGRKLIDTKSKKRVKADYIYMGSKPVNGVEYTPESLEKMAWKYKIVYNKDGAQVWKIL